MDDSFDELIVPDNWLELGSKRKSEGDDDADSSPARIKRFKLENGNAVKSTPSDCSFDVDTTRNNGFHKDSSHSESHDMSASDDAISLNDSKLSRNKISSAGENSEVEVLEISDGTLEDAFVNEADFDTNQDPGTEIDVEAGPDVTGNIQRDCLSNTDNSPVIDVSHSELMPTVTETGQTSGASNRHEDNISSYTDNSTVTGISQAEPLLIATESGETSSASNRHEEISSNAGNSTITSISHTEPAPVATVPGQASDANNSHENVSAVPEDNDEHKPRSASNTDASSEQKSALRKISSLVRDAHIISSIISSKDSNEIYDLLLNHRDREDRLDYVTSLLINSSSSSPSTTKSPTIDIFDEVQQVITAIPAADANEVYAILESLPASANRVKKVISKLQKSFPMKEGESGGTKPALLKKNSSIADDPFLKNDPLFCDMRTIAKMFPDKDRNEIYALLEANFGKENRLQTVINELISAEASSLGETQPSNLGDATASASDADAISLDVERMKIIFPDCDPNYLYNKLESLKDQPNRTDLLAAEMFDKKDYPKLKDLVEKEKVKQEMEKSQQEKEKAKNLTLTVEEFLERFPDPVKTFGDESRELNHNYRTHADVALKNEFPMLKTGYLKTVLTKHGGHFYPTYQEISADVVSIPLGRRKEFGRFMKNPRSHKFPMPETVDEYFYHELWFVHNEQTVIDYPKKKEEERRLKIEDAKSKGELFECCCCYDDECLFEHLASCPEGHLFCKTCVIRSTEAAFGEMKTKFPCLTGECDLDIPLSTLQGIIPANLFSKVVRRMQEEEVLQANIPDLVTCPFCPFATIMPNPDDKIFKCLNPDCLKESCRLCQEPNHIPLRCNEVEKKAATNMRTYIENQISEAVMRKCDKCGKRFVKDTGCNKMTCICGATSCYACKKQGIDYNHFHHNQKCAEADPVKIHERDMQEAAARAKNQYLLDHPEAADIELKTDVTDMIKDYKQLAAKQRGKNFGYDDEEEYSDDEDEYDEDSDESSSEDEDHFEKDEAYYDMIREEEERLYAFTDF